MPKHNYILVKASKTHCPKCKRMVDLLCTDEEMLPALQHDRWFYICWNCKLVAEVGRGEVKRDDH